MSQQPKPPIPVFIEASLAETYGAHNPDLEFRTPSRAERAITPEFVFVTHNPDARRYFFEVVHLDAKFGDRDGMVWKCWAHKTETFEAAVAIAMSHARPNPTPCEKRLIDAMWLIHHLREVIEAPDVRDLKRVYAIGHSRQLLRELGALPSETATERAA